MKRMIAFLLSFALAFSMLPVSAVAAEVLDEETVAVETEAVETAAVTEAATEPTIAVETMAETLGTEAAEGEIMTFQEPSNVARSTTSEFTYDIRYDGSCEITGYYGYETVLTIPSEIDGYVVKRIGSEAFRGCNFLISVTIPESVTTIGGSAFRDCSSLTSITIPESVTSILGYAFYGCSSLTSIKIPEGVTSIGSSTFSGCSSLTSIKIPEGVAEIEGWAFEKCSSLTNITIPESVTKIGAVAFADCSSLTSVTIPEGIRIIEGSTFSGCSSLTSITIPKSVTTINGSAFRDCSSLTSITIPERVKIIEDRTFYGCSSLTSIKIPEDVTAIGDEAFYGCSSLTSITIPKSVTTIEGSAFSGCSSLTSITIPERVKIIEDRTFYGCSSLTSITIPEGVTAIGEYAFYDCSSLTSVKIPEGVTSIEEWAFRDCSSLTSIKIPEGATSIGGSAFSDCSSLNSIKIPEDVTSIGVSAFSDCSSLTSITFSGQAPTIGWSAFWGVTATAYYPAGDSTWTEEVMKNYGGKITWKPYCIGAHTIVIDEAVRASCTQTGLAEGKHCSVCGMVLVAQETIAATGHSFGNWATTTAPTCTVKGGERRDCNKCDHYETREINAKGHTEVIDSVVAATCTTTGKTEGKHCSVCNEVLTPQIELPALGHDHKYICDIMTKTHTVECSRCPYNEKEACSFDDGIVIKDPTAEENGVKTYTCAKCQGTYEEVLPRISDVTRLFGNDRYRTAIKIAEELKATWNVEKFNTIVVASGDDFPDALAGTYLASVVEAPIVLNSKAGYSFVAKYIEENLTKNGTIYLLGGTAALKESVEASMKKITPNVVRLAGADRYATCLEILKEAAKYKTAREVMVCSGVSYTDTLVASATENPVLLVYGGASMLNQNQKAYLADKNHTIVGDGNAVGIRMENALSKASIQNGRIAGDSCVTTSIAVAENYFWAPAAAVLASGKDYPDGLCGGVLAIAKQAPLLLVADQDAAIADYIADYDIQAGIIVGGTAAVSKDSVTTIFGVTEPEEEQT